MDLAEQFSNSRDNMLDRLAWIELNHITMDPNQNKGGVMYHRLMEMADICKDMVSSGHPDALEAFEDLSAFPQLLREVTTTGCWVLENCGDIFGLRHPLARRVKEISGMECNW